MGLKLLVKERAAHLDNHRIARLPTHRMVLLRRRAQSSMLSTASCPDRTGPSAKQPIKNSEKIRKFPQEIPLQTSNRKTIHWIETSSIVYLAAPLLLFFAFFIRISLAIPACLFITFCLINIACKTNWHPLHRFSPQVFYALSLAATWLWLAGNFGELTQNSDWIKHYALLNYLAMHPWPAVATVDGLDGQWVVRYSLGWYIVPAFALKYLNPHAQRLISGIWSLIGLFLFFRMLLTLISGRRAKIITPLIFIVFSGADVIGTALTHFRMGPIYHLEWWNGWIEYGSSMTSLFWVPQHAIAVWLGIAMLMRQDRIPTLSPYLIFLFSAIAFWSPFAAIGLAPFGAWLMWQNGVRKTVLNWRPIVTVMLLIAPLFLYFSASSGQIPHGFIWTSANRCVSGVTGAPCFSWTSYLLFIAVEFAVPTIILLLARTRYKAMLIIAATSLLLIPLYRLGASNDFGMRVSMAGLAVIAILSGEVISTGPPAAAVAMAVALAFGLPTPGGEVARAFADTSSADVNSNLEKSLNDHPEVLIQYFARLPVSVLRPRSSEIVDAR